MKSKKYDYELTFGEAMRKLYNSEIKVKDIDLNIFSKPQQDDLVSSAMSLGETKALRQLYEKSNGVTKDRILTIMDWTSDKLYYNVTHGGISYAENKKFRSNALEMASSILKKIERSGMQMGE